MTELKKITIRTNPWCIPSPEHALDGWLEGGATKKEIRQARAKAAKAREAWKPSVEGQQLVEQLKAFVGTRVQIQFWNSIMFMCDEEGPFPLQGDCKDVLLLQQGQFVQAFMALDNVRAIPTPEGYSPMGYLIAVDGVHGQLAPVADVYEVWPVNPDGSVSAEQQQNQIVAIERYNARIMGVRELVNDTFTAAQLDSLYPLWSMKAKMQEGTD